MKIIDCGNNVFVFDDPNCSAQEFGGELARFLEEHQSLEVSAMCPITVGSVHTYNLGSISSSTPMEVKGKILTTGICVTFRTK